MAIIVRPRGTAYARPMSVTHETPCAASFVREIGEQCNRMLADGRWHMSSCRAWDTPSVLYFANHSNRVKVLPGPNAQALDVYALLQAPSSATQFQICESACVVELADGLSEAAPRMIQEYAGQISATPWTEQEVYVHCTEYTVKALTIADRRRSALTVGTDVAHNTAAHRHGGLILAGDVADLVAAQKTVAQKLRKVLVQQGSIGVPLADALANDSSTQNIFDPSRTSWSADAVGFIVGPSAPWYGRQATLAIRALARVTGEGLSCDLYIKGANGATSTAMVVTATAATWYSATMSIAAPANLASDWTDNLQVFYRMPGEVGGVHLVSLSIWETDNPPS